MKSVGCTCLLLCAVVLTLVGADPSNMSAESVSPLQACLWQCGQCFMDSDKLLMACANDVCIQQKFPQGVLEPLMFKACPGLVKMFEYMRHGHN